MRVVALTWLCAAMLWGAVAQPVFAAVSVNTAVERSPVFVGEVVALTIEVEGTQAAEVPEFAQVDGLTIRYVGPTSRFSSVNGRVTTSVTHSYAVTGQRPGRYRVGPFSVRAGGEAATGNAVEIVVAPRSTSDTQAAGEPIRLVLEPEKSTAYIGERIALRLELMVGDLAVDNLHFPELDAEGFTADPFTQPTRRQEIVGGKRWTVLGFRTVLTPLRAGTLTLGPARMQIDVIETARSGGRGSLFDNFIGSGRRRTQELRSAAAPIEVSALPAEGRPRDFSGAVGQFELDVEAAPTTLAVGDPITLRIAIRGVGNLENTKPPQARVGDEFRSYDPTVVDDQTGPGKLAVEQVLIPRDETVRRIPAVRFSFFEPESGTYRTLERGPFPLQVQPSSVARGPEIVGVTGEDIVAAPEKLGRDIVYIKERPGDLRRHGDALHLQPWFALFQLVPPFAAFAGIRLVRRRRAREADPRSRRFRRAGRSARKELSALASKVEESRFYDELTAAVGRYLAAKLDLPPGALERNAVLAQLARAGVAGAGNEAAARYFELVERVRYAATGGSVADQRSALELARALVDALEGERGLARRSISVALLVLSLCAAATAAAQSRDLHTIFHDGNTAYRDGDYAAAMQEYERLLAAGFESDALLFNLGNAQFKQGRNGLAILAYERARRLSPRDPDIATNLALAREIAKSPDEPPALWKRVLLAPAWSFSTAELAAAWTVLWLAAWAAIAAVGLGRSLRATAAALSLSVLFIGASLALRLWSDEISSWAVVVGPGVTAARFEPASGGKEHFRLEEGALVEVRDAREGWAQVRRRDGLRGWIPEESVGRL